MEQPMKILITGKNGFIAKNSIDFFNIKNNVLAVSHNESDELLLNKCKKCELILHFAAIQRSTNEQEFWDGNVQYTKKLIYNLEYASNYVPILFTTSINIDKKSLFSETKLEAERLIREYGKKHNIPVYIFKLNHIFGKYGKPNFNNVIATFCYNVANNLPITINNPATSLKFSYINDVMYDFEKAICLKQNSYYLNTSIQYEKTLGEVVMYLGNIKNGYIPKDDFGKKLFLTYNSYC